MFNHLNLKDKLNKDIVKWHKNALESLDFFRKICQLIMDF